MVVLFVCARNLVRGRTGRAMIAIRDNPIAAKTMGINIALYKSLVFAVSALYTGVAGVLGAIIVQFVAPDSFTFLLAITFLVGSVIGGITSITGAIFGGFFVLMVPNLAETVADMSGQVDAKGLSWAVYGIFLILAVYLMPSGGAGMMRNMVTAPTHLRRIGKTKILGEPRCELKSTPLSAWREALTCSSKVLELRARIRFVR